MGNHDHLAHEQDAQQHESARLPSGAQWVFIAFVAIAAIFLLMEHRAHMLGALPYLILLACPLMHFFMHGGHGGHGGHSHGSDRARMPGGSDGDGKDWT